MTHLTLTHDATTVTLSDGQTAWTLDRDNAARLVAQLGVVVGRLDGELPERPRCVPSVWSNRGKFVPGKVVAP